MTTPETATPQPLFEPDSYRLCDSVGYLMARAKGVLSSGVEQEVSGLDITHAQATCLMMIAHQRARTVTDLGRELGTDMGSVTRLLDRMEKRGLVSRQRSETDRRVVAVTVTPVGQDLVDRLPVHFCAVLNRAFAGFSTEEIDTLRAMLHRVIANGCVAQNRPESGGAG